MHIHWRVTWSECCQEFNSHFSVLLFSIFPRGCFCLIILSLDFWFIGDFLFVVQIYKTKIQLSPDRFLWQPGPTAFTRSWPLTLYNLEAPLTLLHLDDLTLKKFKAQLQHPQIVWRALVGEKAFSLWLLIKTGHHTPTTTSTHLAQYFHQ